MAVTVLKNTAQWGVEVDETGINIESVSVNAKPELKEKLPARDNTVRDFAVGPTMQDITAKGEVTGSTTPYAASWTTAATLANDHALMGATGILLLDEVTDDQTRSGWRSYTAKMSSYSGIAAIP